MTTVTSSAMGERMPQRRPGTRAAGLPDALQPPAVDLAVPAELVPALARGAERDAPDPLDARHGAPEHLALAGHAHDEDPDRLGLRRRRDRRLQHHLGE